MIPIPPDTLKFPFMGERPALVENPWSNVSEKNRRADTTTKPLRVNVPINTIVTLSYSSVFLLRALKGSTHTAHTSRPNRRTAEFEEKRNAVFWQRI